MKNILPDLFIVSGAVSVSYGSFLIYEAAGFVVAGLLSIAIGIQAARNKS